MAGFNEDQIQEYQEVFGIFDNVGDGKVPVALLGELLRACGQNPTEAEWRKLVGDDPEKRISFNEYLPLLKDTAKTKDKTLNQSDFIEAFKVFDKEQNGHISTAELRHLLSNLGEKMTEEECEMVFQGHEDAQGNVNYEELIDHVVYNRTL